MGGQLAQNTIEGNPFLIVTSEIALQPTKAIGPSAGGGPLLRGLRALRRGR